MDSFFNFQAAIMLFLQENIRSGFLTSILEFMTDLGNEGIIWIVPAALLLIKKKTRACGAAILLSLVLSLLLTNGLLKNIFQEARPFVAYPEIIPLVTEVSASSYAFPSGHATSSFAAAFVIWRYLPRKWGICAMIIAVLISFSRIYLGVHYPGDVLAGFILGYIIARLSEAIIIRVGIKAAAGR